MRSSSPKAQQVLSKAAWMRPRSGSSNPRSQAVSPPQRLDPQLPVQAIRRRSHSHPALTNRKFGAQLRRSGCVTGPSSARLRGFHQGHPGLGCVVNARSLVNATIVIKDDAACAAGGRQSRTAGTDAWKAIGDVQLMTQPAVPPPAAMQLFVTLQKESPSEEKRCKTPSRRRVRVPVARAAVSRPRASS